MQQRDVQIMLVACIEYQCELLLLLSVMLFYSHKTLAIANSQRKQTQTRSWSYQTQKMNIKHGRKEGIVSSSIAKSFSFSTAYPPFLACFFASLLLASDFANKSLHSSVRTKIGSPSSSSSSFSISSSTVWVSLNI